MPSWSGLAGKRRVLVMATTAAAIVVAGGVAVGVTVAGSGHGNASVALAGATPSRAMPTPSLASARPGTTASAADASSAAKKGTPGSTPSGSAPAGSTGTTQPSVTEQAPASNSQAPWTPYHTQVATPVATVDGQLSIVAPNSLGLIKVQATPVNEPYLFTPGLAEGGEAPYTWTVTGLPPGLTASGTQELSDQVGLSISGTPTKAGVYYLTATARDSESTPQTATIQFEIQVDPPPWSITIALPNGTVGVPYSAPVTLNGAASATWSADGLPRGLAINPSTGVISGTPTVAFDQTITIFATVTQPVYGTVTKREYGGIVIESA